MAVLIFNFFGRGFVLIGLQQKQNPMPLSLSKQKSIQSNGDDPNSSNFFRTKVVSVSVKAIILAVTVSVTAYRFQN